MATTQDSFKVYLPQDDADWLRQTAKLDERTVTALIRIAVRVYREQREAVEAAA